MSENLQVKFFPNTRLCIRQKGNVDRNDFTTVSDKVEDWFKVKM